VKLEIVVGADEAEMILQAVERARDELRNSRRRSAEAAAVTEVARDVSAETPPDEDQRQPSAPRPVPVPDKPAPGAEARPKVTAADALVHVATSYFAGGLASTETGRVRRGVDGGDGAVGQGPCRAHRLAFLSFRILFIQ
jgi:hypothetical protein